MCQDLDVVAELSHEVLEVLLAAPSLLDMVPEHHHRRHQHEHEGVGTLGEREDAHAHQRGKQHGQPRHLGGPGSLGMVGHVEPAALEQRRKARRPREGAVVCRRRASDLVQAIGRRDL